eukprot:2198715-Amphidinium_carterae.1
MRRAGRLISAIAKNTSLDTYDATFAFAQAEDLRAVHVAYNHNNNIATTSVSRLLGVRVLAQLHFGRV